MLNPDSQCVILEGQSVEGSNQSMSEESYKNKIGPEKLAYFFDLWGRS